MNNISKLGWSIICLGALLLMVVLVCLLRPSGPPRYHSISMVVVQGYTNVFLTPSFQHHLMDTVPNIRRLSVVQVQTAPPTGGPSVASGAVFTIYTLGASEQEATNTCNAAALQLQQTVLKDYGIGGKVFPALDVHLHSIYRDVFKAKFEEIFE